jgi:hypothetical protein
VINAVPGPVPVVTPDEPATVAMAVLPLVQEPPVVGLLNVVVPPWHSVVVPAMGKRAFTVTVAIAVQPLVVT